MVTTHQFLSEYPVLPESEKLIIGTIHPHNYKEFKTQFFYGNENSIWNILSDAFPQELPKPIILKGILEFLRKRKISLSDTIIKCNRKTNSALDEDLEPIELNHALKEQIKSSSINEIFLTSGFSKNNAFRIFYVDILKLKVNKEIKTTRVTVLPPELFGRSIKLNILYSPARTANVGLSKSKLYLENKHRFKGSSRPVQDFKVWYYKDMFSH
jgi:G:T/U-mismatch repair DNA glycosylase